MTKNRLYIAYGSNLNPPQMAFRCPTAKVLGASKEMLEVELNGRPVNAMVYIMNDGREFGAPSDFYLHTIAEGYETAGFDTDFWIRRWRNPSGWHRSSRPPRMHSSAFGNRNGGEIIAALHPL